MITRFKISCKHFISNYRVNVLELLVNNNKSKFKFMINVSFIFIFLQR